MDIPSALLKCTSMQIAIDLKVALSPTQQDLHLHCDNQGNNISVIKLAKNWEFHARTKHLEIHHHFVCERVPIGGEVSILHVKFEDQTAHIFTKALNIHRFERNRAQLGMIFVT